MRAWLPTVLLAALLGRDEAAVLFLVERPHLLFDGSLLALVFDRRDRAPPFLERVSLPLQGRAAPVQFARQRGLELLQLALHRPAGARSRDRGRAREQAQPLDRRPESLGRRGGAERRQEGAGERSKDTHRPAHRPISLPLQPCPRRPGPSTPLRTRRRGSAPWAFRSGFPSGSAPVPCFPARAGRRGRSSTAA